MLAPTVDFYIKPAGYSLAISIYIHQDVKLTVLLPLAYYSPPNHAPDYNIGRSERGHTSHGGGFFYPILQSSFSDPRSEDGDSQRPKTDMQETPHTLYTSGSNLEADLLLLN